MLPSPNSSMANVYRYNVYIQSNSVNPATSVPSPKWLEYWNIWHPFPKSPTTAGFLENRINYLYKLMLDKSIPRGGIPIAGENQINGERISGVRLYKFTPTCLLIQWPIIVFDWKIIPLSLPRMLLNVTGDRKWQVVVCTFKLHPKLLNLQNSRNSNKVTYKVTKVVGWGNIFKDNKVATCMIITWYLRKTKDCEKWLYHIWSAFWDSFWVVVVIKLITYCHVPFDFR